MSEEHFMMLATELKSQAEQSSDRQESVSFSLYIMDMANRFLREYQGNIKADFHESASATMTKDEWKCLMLVKKIIEKAQRELSMKPNEDAESPLTLCCHLIYNDINLFSLLLLQECMEEIYGATTIVDLIQALNLKPDKYKSFEDCAKNLYTSFNQDEYERLTQNCYFLVRSGRVADLAEYLKKKLDIVIS
jgi:hypothetical protein